jgi:hypothetical protein
VCCVCVLLSSAGARAQHEPYTLLLAKATQPADPVGSIWHQPVAVVFDLDEYLVLPQGGTLANSSCSGRPLLGSRRFGSLDVNSSSGDSGPLSDGSNSSNSSSSSPLLGGASPVGSFARYSARSCRQGVELDCWREGHALPTAAALELVLERRPYQFPKPLVHADRTLTLSVHYVWAWGAKVTDIPPSCGFLLHLHALVNQRSHFMLEGLEPQWRLPQAGSAQVVSNDSATITAQLHVMRYCADLRKEFEKRHPGAAKLSMC